MKRVFFLFLSIGLCAAASAQDSVIDVTPRQDTVPVTVDTLPITNPNDLIEETNEESREKSRTMKFDQLALANRSKDHLLIQIGYDGWANTPDSINLKGFARSFNMYFMFDFPFKTNPHLSVGIGAGISTGNMYFKDMYVDITGKSVNRADFRDVSDTIRFKKFKVMTTFLEAPIELRWVSKPETPKKSFKAAIGGKIGTLLGASAKGKTQLNSSGGTLNAFTQKEKSKRFFSSTRLSATGRVGYGNLSLFGSYQLNPFFKEGLGPDVRPFSVGITISGL